ncbi:MAG: DUF6056 family protein [Bacteroidales bacterium]|nr:DUF6056 family protein [Bacteroidales bacterium]
MPSRSPSSIFASPPRRMLVASIVLFLGAVGVLMWMYAKDVVLMNDEVYYQAVWHSFFGDSHEMIQSLGDVARSQWNHYFTWSGRALVHGVEQVFSGVLPTAWFYPLNTCVLLLFFTLIAGLGAKRLVARSLWPYLIAVVGSLYVMGEAPNLLTGINLGVNYLWGGTAMLLAIVLWRRWKDRRFRWWQSVLIVLLGIALGWTHEGFCGPLSLAFGIYYLTRRSRLRFDGSMWLVAGYWLGTLILVAAPGNYLRGATEENVLSWSSMLVYLLYIKCFWILLANVAVIAVLKWSWVRRCWRASKFLVMLLGIQVVVLLMIHASPRSMMPVDLTALVLLVRLWMAAFESRVGQSWWSYALSVLVAVGIVWHIVGLVKIQKVMNQSIQAVVDDYVAHDDGMAILAGVPSDPLYDRWVRRIIHPPSLWWRYGRDKDWIMIVSEPEADGLAHPERVLVESNRMYPGVPFYGWEYCQHMWIPGDSVAPGACYRMILGAKGDRAGVGAALSNRLKGVASVDTIYLPADSLHIHDTRFGRWGYLEFPDREIIAIEPLP